MNDNREKKAEASFGKNQNQPKQENRQSAWNGSQGKQAEKQPKVGEIQREVKDELLKIGEKQHKMDEEQPKMVEKQMADPIATTSSTLEPTNVDGWPFQKPKWVAFYYFVTRSMGRWTFSCDAITLDRRENHDCRFSMGTFRGE